MWRKKLNNLESCLLCGFCDVAKGVTCYTEAINVSLTECLLSTHGVAAETSVVPLSSFVFRTQMLRTLIV